MNEVQVLQSRRLAQLGILLQTLHVLFGITAIIGMLIAHTHLASTEGTIYHSHLKWQLTTFWGALAAYAVAVWLWLSVGILWPVVLVAGIVAYRILVNLQHWVSEQPINRML